MYLNIFIFNLLKFLTYPLEICFAVLGRIVKVAMLILFWNIVSSSGTTISSTELISYFLVATAISEFLMAINVDLAWNMQRSIMSGEINNLIIKPVKIIPYLYAATLGQKGLTLSLAAISFVAGLLISGKTTAIGLALFPIALLSAGLIALSFNILIGIVGFYTPQARPVSLIFANIAKILAGSIIPLSFFPPTLQRAVSYTPFPSMVYSPIQTLYLSQVNPSAIGMFAVSAAWGISLLIISLLTWRRALKRYEAIGI